MTRAQAHTVEAFIAALLLVSGVLFAVQATAITPLSASTSNQHIENQQRAIANDLLATADTSGDLREATLYWDPDAGNFTGSSVHGYYTQGGPPNAFGASLNQTFYERGIAFNVRVLHQRPGRAVSSTKMVYMGTPSDNAVSAMRSVVVFDGTRLMSSASDATLAEVESDSSQSFYATDVDDGRLYSILEVRITVWRI